MNKEKMENPSFEFIRFEEDVLTDIIGASACTSVGAGTSLIEEDDDSLITKNSLISG